MRIAVLATMLLLTATPCALAAEAVTFAGTIGKLPIIVELAKDKNGGFEAGRYAYMAKGADIPLHAGAGKDDGLTLTEEKPCTEALCKDADDKVADKGPTSATWTLKFDSAGGMSGTWQDSGSSKTLPIALQRKGSRMIADGDDVLDALAPDAFSSGQPGPAVIGRADLPYDFLKMARPLKEGPITKVGELAYRMDQDARVGLDYPTVLSLGGADIAPVNTYLAQQRLQFEISSFSCLSRAYLGFGWSGFGGEGTSGFDGGSTVTVNLLTSRLIGLTEGGSFDCGGAHPDNFSVYRLADSRTGEALVPEKLLRGWVARDDSGKVVNPAKAAKDASLTWGPSDELVDYVKTHRDKMDDQNEQDCGYDDLIAQNLAVYFTKDSLVFALQDLPHVIFACGYDMVTVPLKEARPLLTDKGATYFSELDK
jgi:hypothetical protein